MATIQNEFDSVLKNYLSEKQLYGTANKSVPSYQALVINTPQIFRDIGNIPSDFLVEGSIGKGNITKTPWVCFFDTQITTSAQHGYYVCILFREDMQGFYLSLNQGWTQYEKTYGVKRGREEIEKNSIKARRLLRSTKNFKTELLDLKATTNLGKGYERGNIYSYFYPASNLPSDKKLIEDLQLLLGAYRELKGIVGKNILDIKSSGSELDFQKDVQETNEAEIPPGPVAKPPQQEKINSSTYKRNPSVGKKALRNSNYKCEIDPTHKTFTSKSTSMPFIEVHHLVPMEKQDDFEFSLDVPENIIALCPNCHRQIHLASESEKQPLLDKLFNLRKDQLIDRGIKIGIQELNIIYKQSESLE